VTQDRAEVTRFLARRAPRAGSAARAAAAP